MKIIFDEIRKEIGRLLKRNTWIKWVCLAIGILALAVCIKVIFFPSIPKGDIGGKDSDTWQQMAELNDGEITTVDFNISDLDSVINMFFMSANRMDIDMMTSVMTPEMIASDFSERTERGELDEIFALYEEAMTRLSQNRTIEKIEIVGGNKMLGGKQRVRLNLYYSELDTPANITLIVKMETDELSVSDYTGETENEELVKYKQYYLDTSVWNMIDAIESEVE
ncbi:hypothetical protein A9986_13565 [Solibacillus silvestris]|nr:hypothetical protein [Solibacillus silvestris]OBW54653.1 hypothetical protein A9986_13565 [Solibacillus silvestris]